LLSQSVPIGVFRDAIDAVVSLIKGMRNCGRQMRFIGLANTSLDDSHARLIAGALRTLAALSPTQEPETLELHRMVYAQATRQMLLNDARRAGVNLLLSKPGGPALKGFSRARWQRFCNLLLRVKRSSARRRQPSPLRTRRTGAARLLAALDGRTFAILC
jgi:hypothetical protein